MISVEVNTLTEAVGVDQRETHLLRKSINHNNTLNTPFRNIFLSQSGILVYSISVLNLDNFCRIVDFCKLRGIIVSAHLVM